MALCVVASLSLGACSTSSKEQIVAGNIVIDDPFENTNRAVMSFNSAVDKVLIHPVVKGYRAIVPPPARHGLRNFLRNLKSPIRLANQILQGDVNGAVTVVQRTVINSLVGAGGLFDVAGYEGIAYEAEDFGQALAVWGVGHGPYMVVPFLGPASLRDGMGYAVDSFADPLRFYAENIDEEGLYYTKQGLDYLDLRESLMDVLEDLEETSIDYYAAVRSAYYQRRVALVNDENEDAQDLTAAYPSFDEY